MKFSEREDLCRISGCYHRFHKACLNNFWFVQLSDDKNEYGVVIHHKLAEQKKCPVCRIIVDTEEANKIVGKVL